MQPETPEPILAGTEWNLANMPPKGHDDVARFAWEMFETSRLERDRQGLPDRWRANDKLRRGDPSLNKPHDKKRKGFTPINLFFSNVERTVAQITAQDPIAEVVDLSGTSEEEETPADLLLTSKIRKWWKDTKQKPKLKNSALKMETYGITIEHPYWDYRNKTANIAVMDCFSWFPAPGNYEDISLDMPYCCNAYPEAIEGVEKRFNVTGVQADDVYNILGEDREENRQVPAGRGMQTVSYEGFDPVVAPVESGLGIRQRRALVIQVWVRDYTTHKVTIKVVVGKNAQSGADVIEEREVDQDVYPGNIRMITITNRGNLLLDDRANPNVNPELPREIVEKTHSCRNLPFYKENSYDDITSVWGFSAAEQTEDLVNKISEIVSRLVAYVLRVMSPPLVVRQGIGITRDMIESRATKPNLVLMPNRPVTKNDIFYVQIPNLPVTFFKVLDLIIMFFDRVYSIEEADRGITPKRVVAAAAIHALQERNAVLIQSKREAIETIVEERGKWAISFMQNFGTIMESVEVQGELKAFTGINYAGRRFQFMVEAGSMMPRTSVWLAELAKDFYEKNAIDRQALLEITNFPRWKEIVERIGEGQLDQALQLLIQAGLPENPENAPEGWPEHLNAITLRQILLEPQGGPGNRPQTGKGGVTARQGQEATGVA